MDYSQEFKNVVIEAEKQEIKMYIGEGNPFSKILFIGQELGQKENKQEESFCDKSVLVNIQEWKDKIHQRQFIDQSEIKKNDSLFTLKGIKKRDLKSVGHTWIKYQVLTDLIYNQESTTEINFLDKIFISELNQSPAKQSKDASKDSISNRITFIRGNKFYQQFPIVILACGKHIKPQEIYDTFGVKFIENGEHKFGNKTILQKFWVHESINDKPKLVIHVRQLSGRIYNTLLEGIALEVKQFLAKHEIKL